MRRGHRALAAVTALLAVPAVLSLPVVTGPAAQIRPVAPIVETLALSEIDPAGLASSAPPAAETEHEGHSHDEVVAAVATGDAPAAQVADHADEADHANLAEEPSEPLEVAAVTAPTDTEPFTLVAVDWTGRAEAGTAVQVRVRTDGEWSEWRALTVNPEHGPDPGSIEAQGVRSGTEPLLVEPGSDGVQVRVDAPGGELPEDAQISLIDPQQSQADALVSPTPVSAAVAAGDPLRPAIITRAQWGADESLRSRGPIYTGALRAGFLHHTASSSNYTPEQAAAQVRALYAYFTLSLGYSDIAYNFFVDRYGRLYEGRYGGMDKNVLGGHTAGFNENTFAVSAIGNFDTYKPTSSEYTAMQAAVSRLFAWKFALNHVDPTATATLVSNSGAGTSNYSSGTSVTVPTVMGHGDIGSTACPGRYIETMVPSIRTQARALMGTQLVSPALTPSVAQYGSAGTTLSATTTTPASWKLEVFSTCQKTPVRTLTGSIASAGTIRATWDQRVAGVAARPGTYTLVLSAADGSQAAYPLTRTFVATGTATSPLGPCAAAQRIGSTDRYAAAVQAGQLAAPDSRTVVIASGADSALADALIASPLASVKGAPRLLVAPSSVPPVVAADITARRATTAFVVGSTTAVSADVVTALRGLGVTTVTRLAGTSRAATAAAVATAMGVRGTGVVVSLDSGASLDLAAVAAAGAATAKRPLLVVTAAGVPSATASAITSLGITSTIVVGGPAAISDSVVSAVRGTRVSGASDPATSQALVQALTPGATRITALPVSSGYGRAVATGIRRPLVLGAGGTAGIAAWLATSSMTAAVAVAPTAVWSDSSVGAIAQAMTTTAVAPVPTSTPGVQVPTAFTFNGAGYGHGVGMSQYGARGMALEGKSAEEIVRYFYTGTTVGAVDDDMYIRVNLLTRRPSAVFRSESLVTGGGGIKVTVSSVVNGTKTVSGSFVGTPQDTFAVTAQGNGVVKVTRTRGTTTTTVGSGTLLEVRWEGTRFNGGTGSDATLLNVATSTSGLATAGHRYRYGFVNISSSPSSLSTFEVVNGVRLGDEYLLGLAEVPSSWPAASLQAQVLAARSYALVKQRTLRSACLCHVDDGGGPYYDQTFAGWAKESSTGGSAWSAAVKATEVPVVVNGTTVVRGKAILSGGSPIQAFYYAASGGRTQDVREVWGASLPYLVSVDDPWSLDPSVPWSQWDPRERSQAQVRAAFGLADVVSLDLSSRTAGGGVKAAVATSSTGATATITGEQLRSRLSLPGTWVSRAVTSYSGTVAAIAAASAASSTSASVVLSASGWSSTTAVAASLARQKGWPMLLTPSSAADAVTLAAVKKRAAARATTIYAVGTSGQLPSTVLAAFDAVPNVTVVRVTGADAPGVSIAAAQLLGRPQGTAAVVASTSDPASLLVASGFSGARGLPLLLVNGTTGSTAVTDYLADVLVPSRTTVVGTASALPDSVLAAFPSPVRIAGATPMATSVVAGRILTPAQTARIVLSTPTSVVSAMAAAPGVPALVVEAGAETAAEPLLQRGTHTLVTIPAVADTAVEKLRLL